MWAWMWVCALLLLCVAVTGCGTSSAQATGSTSAAPASTAATPTSEAPTPATPTSAANRPANTDPKTIGLIGGISWHSSIEYYRMLNEMVNARLGGLSSAKILLYSIEFGSFSREEVQAEEGDWDELIATMVDAAQRLKRGGADFIVICSNTMHSAAPAIENETSLRVVHIADAAAEAVRARGLSTVALLGTKYTMEQPFCAERLTRQGLKVVTPNQSERDLINSIIFYELCAGQIKDSSRQQFVAIINRLVREEGAQGVILGCTEIPLLIGQDDVEVPVFDTMTIHAQAAAEAALE